jgi:hypothetical protein
MSPNLPKIPWDPTTNPGKFEVACDFELLNAYAQKLTAACDDAADAMPSSVPDTTLPAMRTVTEPEEAMAYCVAAANSVARDVMGHAYSAIMQLLAYAAAMVTAGKMIAGTEDEAQCRVNQLAKQIPPGYEGPSSWLNRSYPAPGSSKAPASDFQSSSAGRLTQQLAGE